MKKLILLLSVITLTFSSCSSDDDSQDSIIGIWNYYQSFENDEEYELDSCDKQDQLTFNSDGTYSSITYYSGNDDTCMVDYESTGTWVNLGDNIYEFTEDEDDYTSTATIIFSGNTFYFIDEDGEDTYKEVYIKN